MISEEELAFLRARLGEAEAVARATSPSGLRLSWHASHEEDGTPAHWVLSDPANLSAAAQAMGLERGTGAAVADHIALNDPQSALREAAIWRGLMLGYSTAALDAKHAGTERATGFAMALAAALRMKAFQYREHPDYAAAAEASNALTEVG